MGHAVLMLSLKSCLSYPHEDTFLSLSLACSVNCTFGIKGLKWQDCSKTEELIASYTPCLGDGDGYIYSNFSEIMTMRRIGWKERDRAEPMTLSLRLASKANLEVVRKQDVQYCKQDTRGIALFTRHVCSLEMFNAHWLFPTSKYNSHSKSTSTVVHACRA